MKQILNNCLVGYNKGWSPVNVPAGQLLFYIVTFTNSKGFYLEFSQFDTIVPIIRSQTLYPIELRVHNNLERKDNIFMVSVQTLVYKY